MKKLFLLIPVAFTALSLTGCKYTGKKIASINYCHSTCWIDFGYQTTIDFETNEFKAGRYIYSEDEDGHFILNEKVYAERKFKTFTDEGEKTLLNDLNEAGFFRLRERYTANAYDGDSWSLIITYTDNTKKESNGYANWPTALRKADRCFEKLLGYKFINFECYDTITSEYAVETK